MLADIMAFVPWPGFGPYESYDADETVAGGERLELAGLEIDVIFTPGHSPGHVTYSIPDEQALFSGDVLFQGSVGRVDLPGGDGPTLLESIRTLVEGFPEETDGLSRPHGDHDARRRAGHEPVPRRAGALGSPHSMAGALPGPAGDLRRPARRVAPRGARIYARGRASCFERAGYGRIETPVFEDTELFARGVGEVDRHRPQGDVHLRRTRAGASSPCGPRRRRRSAAPTSSTACTSCRSR